MKIPGKHVVQFSAEVFFFTVIKRKLEDETLGEFRYVERLYNKTSKV